MKAMHERFATELNRRHLQHGHVFGARFANRLVRTDRHLHGCFRYIARNPVEGGSATPRSGGDGAGTARWSD
jgi:hypothetical protein